MKEELVSRSVEHVATFRLGGMEFVVPISDIQEILVLSNITDVPLAPPFMNCIMNSRGRVVTILDLFRLLFCKTRSYDEEARVILLKHADMNIGLLVERIMQIEFIAKNNIEGLTEEERGEKIFIFTGGVLRSEYTDRVVNIIDCEKVFRFCMEYKF